MSNRAVNWARTIPGLSSSEAFVLWVICDRFNEHVGIAWPSIKSISKDTRLSSRTVSRALKTLSNRGIIIRKRTISDRHAGWASNTYFLAKFGGDDHLVDAENLEVVWSHENHDTKFRNVDRYV